MGDNNDINEKEWFLLFNLSKLGGLIEGVSLTTKDIAQKTKSTQQTVSRRLISLIEKGYVTRVVNKIHITEKGKSKLRDVYYELSEVFGLNNNRMFYGEIITGMGEGKYYIKIEEYFLKIKEFLGEEPYLGTLNIKLEQFLLDDFYSIIRAKQPYIIPSFEKDDRTFGEVKCYPVLLCNSAHAPASINCLLLDIRRTSHEKGVIELVSSKNLRDYLGLKDGTQVGITFQELMPS